MGRQKKPTGVAAMVAKVRPLAESAQSKAGPMVESAKERVGPAMDEAQKKVVAAMSSAATATEPYRQEAKKRGLATWYALRGAEPEPSNTKRHWLRWSVIVAAVGGGIAVAYRMFRNGSAPAWEPKEADADGAKHVADDEALANVDKPDAEAEADATPAAKVTPMDKPDEREPVSVGAKHAGRTVNRQRPKPDAES